MQVFIQHLVAHSYDRFQVVYFEGITSLVLQKMDRTRNSDIMRTCCETIFLKEHTTTQLS